MRRFTILSLLLSLIIPILVFIITIVVNNVFNFSFSIVENLDIILLFFIVILLITIFALFIKMFPSYKRTRAPIIGLFLLFLGFSLLAALFTGLITIFWFENIHIQRVWIHLPTFFLYSTLFYLSYSNIEMYYKGLEIKQNRLILSGFGIFLLISGGINSLSAIFNYSELNNLNFIFLILGAIFSFGALTWSGFVLANKVIEETPKKAFKLIGYAGAVYIAGFLANFAYFLLNYLTIDLKPLNWFYWLLWSVGSILMYMGFTLPIKKDTGTD